MRPCSQTRRQWNLRVCRCTSRPIGTTQTVAEAAVIGRVATVLIEAERQVPGRIDTATGRVEFAKLGDPEVDDTLDDLAELVVHAGGRVVVVPASRMPSTTRVAAIYRF